MARPGFPSATSIFVVFTAIFAFQVAGLRAEAQSPQYTITDLGVFTARALNDSGRVAGSKANNAVLDKDGFLTVITPPGALIGEAFGINGLNHVVGRGYSCESGNTNCMYRGFIYRNGTFTIIGTLGGRDSQALGINDSGQVTGSAATPAPSPGLAGDDHAYIFQNGTLQDLGPNIGTPTSIGTCINASGQVAGSGMSNTARRGAFYYSSGNAVFFETRGFANDVNNAGQVVGTFGIGGGDDGSGRAFLFSGGVRQDLGTLKVQHTYSSAYALNNAGTIVGISSESWFTRQDERAFLYSGGVMRDLNALIPAGSGWQLNGATDINDAGQIVGNGKLNGQDHAFLLTPTEPMLIVDPTNKAITLESISFLSGPFHLTTPYNLGSDQRTRITLVARNVEVIAGENIAPPTVQAEDPQTNLFSLPIEFVGKIPGANWLTQIVVRLPDELTTGGDLQVSVSYRGRTSNRGTITVLPNPDP